MERQTPDGLPVLQEGILDVLQRDSRQYASEKKTQKFLEDIKRRIEHENPLYLEEIKRHARDTLSNGLSQDVAIGIIIGAETGYELLRRQAEANKLNEELSS